MSWLKRNLKWIVPLFLILLFSLGGAFLPAEQWLLNFSTWLRQLGLAGALIFIGLYAVGAVLFIPGAVFTLAAGLIYGMIAGTAVAISGATLGAACAFLVARYLVRERVERLGQRNPRFNAIDKAIGREGWKIVGLCRLSPLIPFNVSNYFYGTTSIAFWPYVAASFLGMFPGTWLFAYFGAIGQMGLSARHAGHDTVEWIFLGLGLFATVTVTVFITRLARNALRNTKLKPEHSLRVESKEPTRQ